MNVSITGIYDNTVILNNINFEDVWLLQAGLSSLSDTLFNVNNITLASNGKMNSSDDYHCIQISQPTDTLTIQEYRTISFNIGSTKTQKAFINSSGLSVLWTFNLLGASGNTNTVCYISYGVNATIKLVFQALEIMVLKKISFKFWLFFNKHRYTIYITNEIRNICR